MPLLVLVRRFFMCWRAIKTYKSVTLQRSSTKA